MIPCHGNLGPRDSGAFIWAIGKSDPIHEGEGLLVGGKEDSNELRLLRHAAILEVADTVKDLPGVGLHQSPVPPAQAEARFQAICKQLPWDRQEDVIPFKTQVMIRNKKQLKLAHAMIETFNEADIGKKVIKKTLYTLCLAQASVTHMSDDPRAPLCTVPYLPRYLRLSMPAVGQGPNLDCRMWKGCRLQKGCQEKLC